MSNYAIMEFQNNLWMARHNLEKIIEAGAPNPPSAPKPMELTTPYFSSSCVDGYEDLMYHYTGTTILSDPVSKTSEYNGYTIYHRSCATIVSEIASNGAPYEVDYVYLPVEVKRNQKAVSYKSYNATTEEIKRECNKFFKSRSKLNELTKKHLEQKNALIPQIMECLKYTADFAVLNNFSLGKRKFVIASSWDTSGKYLYNPRKKNEFSTKATMVQYKNGPSLTFTFPWYFFDECMTNGKKDYKTRTATYKITFDRAAAITAICDEFIDTSASATSILKPKTTVKQISKRLEEYAEYEKTLISNLDYDLLSRLFKKEIDAYDFNAFHKKNAGKNKVPVITIRLPYLGLDRVINDDEGKNYKEIATAIHKYISSLDNISAHAKYYNEVMIPNYHRDYKEYETSVYRYNDSIKQAQNSLINLLPGGKADLPYVDLYIELCQSGSFSSIYQINEYVANRRYQNQMTDFARQMLNKQAKVEKKLDIIAIQQQKIHQTQIENHQATMQKLNSIHADLQRPINLTVDVTVYNK